jgi:hypothetical protein
MSMSDPNAPQPLRADEDASLPAPLRRLARRYAAQPAYPPAPEQTSRLVSRLLALDAPVRPPAAPTPGGAARSVRLARWRLRLLGPAFWLASLVLLALGAAGAAPLHLLTPLSPGTALILLAPLTVVLGLAHAFDGAPPGLRAVEGVCPVRPLEALTGLVLAIIGFDCLFGTLATGAVALAGWAPFAALLVAWLAPLLVLAGVTLPLALRWGPGPATLLAAGPWLLLVAFAQRQPLGALALPTDAPSLVGHLIAGLVGGLVLLLALGHGPAWPSPTGVAPRTRPERTGTR